MAGLATSGTLTHWFADQFARDLDAQSAMAALAAEAETSPPGANGLVFLPYFSGERTPIHDPHAKGAVLGLTLASTRADVYRALIEGIAFATNHIFETYAEAGAPPGQSTRSAAACAIESGRRRPPTCPATRRSCAR